MTTMLEQAKAVPMQEVFMMLEDHDKCPICGHKLDIGYSNRCRCNKCPKGPNDPKNYSTVDLVMLSENINIAEAIDFILGNRPVEKSQLEHMRAKYEKEAEEKKAKNKKIIDMTFKNCIEPNKGCLKYLENRCIKEALGTLDKEYIEIKSNVYNGIQSIVYRFPKQGTGIQKSLIKGPDGKRFVKNLGSVRPLIHKGYESNEYVIVEGIEDALTCHVLGYNFICLNSISNAQYLIDLIKNNLDKFKDKELLLCTDNDAPGKECMEQLTDFFESVNVKYGTFKFYDDIILTHDKDINSWHVNRQQKEDKDIKNEKIKN